MWCKLFILFMFLYDKNKDICLWIGSIDQCNIAMGNITHLDIVVSDKISINKKLNWNHKVSQAERESHKLCAFLLDNLCLQDKIQNKHKVSAKFYVFSGSLGTGVLMHNTWHHWCFSVCSSSCSTSVSLLCLMNRRMLWDFVGKTKFALFLNIKGPVIATFSCLSTVAKTTPNYCAMDIF